MLLYATTLIGLTLLTTAMAASNPTSKPSYWNYRCGDACEYKDTTIEVHYSHYTAPKVSHLRSTAKADHGGGKEEAAYKMPPSYPEAYDKSKDRDSYPYQSSENTYRPISRYYDCTASLEHFSLSKLPSLQQCARNACTPGKQKAHIQRALAQCYALEDRA
ncbi:uncharacterized protein SPPG_03364 [Spizellomyces punctatus DAOM BR117]|uniref:Uncharacterized protein n=1 Tax=Spizellomyces punctatus (strain DAOM BR117) TaxID=645134 RepID=A0A0L0HL88_SPIPD|nr:uncharacterized protein SPPG_03364 [Spizellomyces punctatus DAOM BR117]KND01564.1 hypothetical protein SPPG_03364 [Spizellomyces punctatus DAOM BR117]|eukprot:XP_016609603.1 hypothetical protein SPPG_03364 [Spizellomyces punctatus DAOM BR117]